MKPIELRDNISTQHMLRPLVQYCKEVWQISYKAAWDILRDEPFEFDVAQEGGAWYFTNTLQATGVVNMRAMWDDEAEEWVRHHSPFDRREFEEVTPEDMEYLKGEPAPLRITLPIVIEGNETTFNVRLIDSEEKS